MKLEELITKLEQIEQQAALTLSEYPHGLTVERQRLIVGIAKQIRSHLVERLQAAARRPAQNDSQPSEAGHLRSVWSEGR
jgi:hypothetical protein